MGNKTSKKVAKGRLDKYYYLAKDQGYRSRAAFKLIQLNKKFGFLEKARVVIDLCAAPGGWMQVCAKYCLPSSTIIGVDLSPIKSIRGCISFKEDITTEKCRVQLKRELKTAKADVVLHDGAPNVGSAWDHDAFIQAELTLKSLALAVEFLREKGTFVTKIFRSKDYFALLWVFNQLFEKVHSTKPASSRDVSAEIFVVCEGFKAPKKIDPKLLDPKYVFNEVEEDAMDERLNIFDKKFGTMTKKKARGYSESALAALVRKTTVSSFVASIDPITTLSNSAELVFDYATGPLDELIYNHYQTTDEIKESIKDLKVLSMSSYKQILRWRERIKLYLANEAKTSPHIAQLLRRAALLKTDSAGPVQTTSDDDLESMEEPVDGSDSDVEITVRQCATDGATDGAIDGAIDGEASDLEMTVEEKERLELQKQIEEVHSREVAREKREHRRDKNEQSRLKERIALKIDGPSSNLVDDESGAVFSLKKIKRESKLNAVLMQTDGSTFVEDPTVTQTMSALVKPDTLDPMFFDNYAEHGLPKKVVPYYLSDDDNPETIHGLMDSDEDLDLADMGQLDAYIAKNERGSFSTHRRSKAKQARSLAMMDELHEMEQARKNAVKNLKIKLEETRYAHKKADIDRRIENEGSSDDFDYRSENTDEEDVVNDKNTLLVKPKHLYTPADRKAAMWFKSAEFSNVIATNDEDVEIERGARKANLHSTNLHSTNLHSTKRNTPVSDESDDGLNNHESAFGMQADNKRRKQMLETSITIVPTQTTFSERGSSLGYGGFAHDSDDAVLENGSSEDEDDGVESEREGGDMIRKDKVISDGTVEHILDAEGLALGSMLVNKKSRHDLMNDSYNRHAYGDDVDLTPKWFLFDELAINRKPIVLSKELVAFYKDKESQLNKKTIKKVAEAKARKKNRLLKKMQQASHKADAIIQGDTNAHSKAKEIAKVYKKLRSKKPETTYITAKKNGTNSPGAKGGRTVIVDARQKKDKRGLKRAAKRIKQSGGKKK